MATDDFFFWGGGGGGGGFVCCSQPVDTLGVVNDGVMYF